MIITLSGKNNFALQKARQEVVNNFVNKHSDIGLAQIDCEAVEPQVVYDELTNLPFLVEKKLVVLNEPSKNKALSEKLPDWLKDSAAIEVMIVEPNVDKRTTFYKFLQTNTKMQSFDPPRAYELPKWVTDYAKENGVSLSSKAVETLIERAGADQQQLAKEIEKLALYKPKIEVEDVEVLVEELPQHTVFDMLDHLVRGDQKRTMELYESLIKRRVDPGEIIGMLGWQLHTLALIRAAGGRQADVVSKTKLHPFVVQKNFALASRLSLPVLKDLVDMVYAAELNIKKNGLNAENVVSVLLLTLTSKLSS